MVIKPPLFRSCTQKDQIQSVNYPSAASLWGSYFIQSCVLSLVRLRQCQWLQRRTSSSPLQHIRIQQTRSNSRKSGPLSRFIGAEFSFPFQVKWRRSTLGRNFVNWRAFGNQQQCDIAQVQFNKRHRVMEKYRMFFRSDVAIAVFRVYPF